MADISVQPGHGSGSPCCRLAPQAAALLHHAALDAEARYVAAAGRAGAQGAGRAGAAGCHAHAAALRALAPSRRRRRRRSGAPAGRRRALAPSGRRRGRRTAVPVAVAIPVIAARRRRPIVPSELPAVARSVVAVILGLGRPCKQQGGSDDGKAQQCRTTFQLIPLLASRPDYVHPCQPIHQFTYHFRRESSARIMTFPGRRPRFAWGLPFAGAARSLAEGRNGSSAPLPDCGT